jgi:hypothetical protein
MLRVMNRVVSICSAALAASFAVHCGGNHSTSNGGRDSSIANTDTGSNAPTDAPAPGGSVHFSPQPGSASGSQTICLYSGSQCGDDQPGTAIFYTLDGSPANEASQLYKAPIQLPAPPIARTVVINAVLVEMMSTDAPGCSTHVPCYGVIVQDGMNVIDNLNTNVACPGSGTDACPALDFEQAGSAMPVVQNGNCFEDPTDDRGVRGVPSAGWYSVSRSQPTVDPYVNSNLSVEMSLQVKSAVDCGTTSANTVGTGDTEFLIPAIRNSNQGSQAAGGTLPSITSIACDACTDFATSFYVAHDYEGSGSGSSAATNLDAANLSELEMDQNQLNKTYYTATYDPTTKVGYGYGTFNMRSSMQDAASVSVTTATGTKHYGQWQYSNQSGDWETFQHFFPNVALVTHDSPMPFGQLAVALDDAITSCPTTDSFTPGTTNSLYQGGEDSYGLEPGFLLVDQGTGSAESILLTGPPGGPVTGCVRGAGGTPTYQHKAGTFASLTVKVQAHATQGVGTGSTGCIGPAEAKNAMYMDYLSLNGNYYGTGASQGRDFRTLMGLDLPQPSITMLDTWDTQKVGSATQSTVCSWFFTSSSDDKFFNQKQPYTKPGTGNGAKIGIFDMHDNVTASWGIIGDPSQAIYMQAP